MADSALDYYYEIEYISLPERYMKVRYFTDSLDSARPDIIKNFSLSYEALADSTIIHDIVKSRKGEITQKWQNRIDAEAAVPGFNPSIFTGTFSDRYKPTVFDSSPGYYNELVYYAQDSRIEDSFEVRIATTLVALSDSAKSSLYDTLTVRPTLLRMKLAREDRLDSVQAAFDSEITNGLLSNIQQAEFATLANGSVSLEFNGLLSQKIKSILGYNDSDFAQFIHEASELNDSYPSEDLV